MGSYRQTVADNDFQIQPSTKIGALLRRFPELQEVLIELAPAFTKLRNPFLRKGVANVATLSHAAAVGGIPIQVVVNRLRAAVGQEPLTLDEANPVRYFEKQPEWFSESKVVDTIDEQSADPNKMPIATVLQRTARIQPGEILELVTTFIPAP